MIKRKIELIDTPLCVKVHKTLLEQFKVKCRKNYKEVSDRIRKLMVGDLIKSDEEFKQ